MRQGGGPLLGRPGAASEPRDRLLVASRTGRDSGRKAHCDSVTEGRVPETLGGSHPSAIKDVTAARKIEYKIWYRKSRRHTLPALGPGFRALSLFCVLGKASLPAEAATGSRGHSPGRALEPCGGAGLQLLKSDFAFLSVQRKVRKPGGSSLCWQRSSLCADPRVTWAGAGGPGTGGGARHRARASR